MKNKIYTMDKEFALKYAKPYCEANGYDFDKLKSVRFYGTANSEGMGGFFLEPLNNGDGGLTVDMLSMPRPIMIVLRDGTIEPYPLLEELRIK